MAFRATMDVLLSPFRAAPVDGRRVQEGDGNESEEVSDEDEGFKHRPLADVAVPSRTVASAASGDVVGVTPDVPLPVTVAAAGAVGNSRIGVDQDKKEEKKEKKEKEEKKGEKKEEKNLVDKIMMKTPPVPATVASPSPAMPKVVSGPRLAKLMKDVSQKDYSVDQRPLDRRAPVPAADHTVSKLKAESGSTENPVRTINFSSINSNYSSEKQCYDNSMKSSVDSESEHDSEEVSTRELLDLLIMRETKKAEQEKKRDVLSRRKNLPKIEYSKLLNLKLDNFVEYRECIEKLGYSRRWKRKYCHPLRSDLVDHEWSEDILQSESVLDETIRSEAYLVLNNTIPGYLKYLIRGVVVGDALGVWKVFMIDFYM